MHCRKDFQFPHEKDVDQENQDRILGTDRLSKTLSLSKVLFFGFRIKCMFQELFPLCIPKVFN